MASKASKLVQDLTNVPNIISGLGLSIAAAQKAFNLDYLENVEMLIGLAKIMLGGTKQDKNGKETPIDPKSDEGQNLAQCQAVLRDLLAALAPPRYQYTETTLTVRLDLAQSMDASGTAGLGVGYGAVAVNAAFSAGYSYDYRAAAECRTVIQAIPADPAALAPLLERARELGAEALALPDPSPVDQQIVDQARATFEKLVGTTPPATAKKES